MTDNDIKKALEEKIEYGYGYYTEIEMPIIKSALDYINCLEAKCAELQGIIVKYNSNLAKQVAENERLKTNLNIELENFASEYDSKIKAEAYKEFADRLKKRFLNKNEVINNTIDNLSKEMVGEDND